MWEIILIKMGYKHSENESLKFAIIVIERHFYLEANIQEFVVQHV